MADVLFWGKCYAEFSRAFCEYKPGNKLSNILFLSFRLIFISNLFGSVLLHLEVAPQKKFRRSDSVAEASGIVQSSIIVHPSKL